MNDVFADKSLLAKWLISLLLPLSIFLIPLSDVFTSELRIFFAITILVILMVAFELVELIIPSILLPTLYFLSGIAPVNIAFGAWTNTTVWMILGALILANVLQECGLLTRIALWSIRKCGGTFTGTLYGLFITGLVLNFITFSNGYIVMMTLAYGVCLAMKLEKSDTSALISFLGMLAGSATVTFMYNPGYLALGEAGIQALQPEFRIMWYDILLYNGPLVILFFGIIWILSKVFKTDQIQFEGGREYFDKEYEKLGPMSIKEKKSLALVTVLMIYLFTEPFHHTPAAYGFMIFPYLLFLPGIKVASVDTGKRTNFTVIFFIAACLGIGMVSGFLGVSDLVSSIVSPLLQGKSSLSTFLIIVLFGVLVNLFMTPYAMMAALSLPFAKIAVDTGVDPLATIMALLMSTDMIFFPHETASVLLMYSFGFISMKRFIQLHFFKTTATFIFFAVVMFPLWKLFGFL